MTGGKPSNLYRVASCSPEELGAALPEPSPRSPFDPRAAAAGGVQEFFERDLARVAAGAHEQGAVGDAEVDAVLGRLAGEEAVGEPAGEPVAAADAVFDLQVVEARPVVELAFGPQDGGPVVDQRRLHAAQRRAYHLHVGEI